MVIKVLHLALQVDSRRPAEEEEETFVVDLHDTRLEIFESLVTPYIYHPQ